MVRMIIRVTEHCLKRAKAVLDCDLSFVRGRGGLWKCKSTRFGGISSRTNERKTILCSSNDSGITTGMRMREDSWEWEFPKETSLDEPI